MKAKDVIKALEAYAPEFLIDSWDNTGFQLGNDEREVKRILLSLDLDSQVLAYAKEKGVDMIINHHPLFFNPIEEITNRSPKGNLVYNLIREDIVVYNAHSNLDQTRGGVNDALAEKLELKESEILCENIEKDGEIYGYGRIGRIEKVYLKDYLKIVKRNLEIDSLLVFGDLEREVEKVALCGGSGSGFIEDAYEKGADIYITGDIKYHDAQEAVDLGMTLVDAGHYHTEKIILPVLKGYLETKFKGELEIELYMESSPSYGIY